jgi:hypothetical protein
MTTISTTTTTLDKKVFTARVRAFISQKYITKYNAAEAHSDYRFNHVIEDIQRFARYNEEDGIPFSFENICYGIRWAVMTGRVNAQTVLAMRALKVSELIALVYEVGTKFDTIVEIPAYLMKKYTEAAA